MTASEYWSSVRYVAAQLQKAGTNDVEAYIEDFYVLDAHNALLILTVAPPNIDNPHWYILDGGWESLVVRAARSALVRDITDAYTAAMQLA